MAAPQLVQQLQSRGALVLSVGPDTIRAVTNLMVAAEDIKRAVAVTAEVLKSGLHA